MKNFLISIFLFLMSTHCFSQENCERDRGTKTPHGRLTTTDCSDSKVYLIKKYISLDDVKILERSYLSEQSFDKERSRWIFRGESLHETGCPDRLYLIDLSVKPVKVIAFGIKKACNVFHWASWGEKRSVIALKNNVNFIYENGKMTLPASDEKLWKSIEPPHAGEGMKSEDAIPFAEDIPPPK
ncbi:MAG: hypothetical protein V4447_12810 [Pseudomonadota bacterium]